MKSEEIEGKLQTATENGQHISPILPPGIKNYLIDIDGTICDDIPNEEPERMLTAEVVSGCIGRRSTNGMMKVM
jgi:hypothetical protein